MRKFFQKLSLVLFFAVLLLSFQNCGKFESDTSKLVGVGSSSSTDIPTDMPDDNPILDDNPDSIPDPNSGTTPRPPPTATPVPQPTPSTPSAKPPAGNTIAISDRSGVAQNNYPLQFGRPFIQGEIANYPQVLVNGTAIPTQANVKQRYPDGSVKHAVISVVIPSIPAGGSLILTFRNQPAGNNTALTQAQMLVANYDFDAVIELTSGGVTKKASARTMLQNGNYTVWNPGPLAQTIVLADHTSERKYDIGFDAYRPFRPMFFATFWPTLNKVTVRYVGEISNTIELEDMTYDLVLKLGHTQPQSVYNKAGLIHYTASRWTKTFTLGGAAEPRIDINHNLAYLKETRFFLNYDTSVTVSDANLTQAYTTWLDRSKDLYEAGSLIKNMPQTGQTSGPAVGPYPIWTVNWLYSGDWRAREIALTNADLAAAWPMHLREGDPARKYDRSQTIPAIGKPISVYARPNITLFKSDAKIDQVTLVGPRVGNYGWVPDDGHCPDPFSAQYVLTGDAFYLEQTQFWPAWSIVKLGSGYRGPNGSYAGIKDQTRGDAWGFRGRVQAAFVSPDDQPEKAYFTEKVNDAIAAWEGGRGITGTQFHQNPMWVWATTNTYYKIASPLYIWKVGYTPLPDWSYFQGNVTHSSQFWQNAFVMFELGRAKEMGFATDAILSWHAKMLTGAFATPGFNRKIIASYQVPLGANEMMFTDWIQVQNSFSPTTIEDLNKTNLGTYSYSVVVGTGASMIAKEPGGAEVWNWIKTNVRDVASPESNLAWKIDPRL